MAWHRSASLSAGRIYHLARERRATERATRGVLACDTPIRGPHGVHAAQPVVESHVWRVHAAVLAESCCGAGGVMLRCWQLCVAATPHIPRSRPAPHPAPHPSRLDQSVESVVALATCVYPTYRHECIRSCALDVAHPIRRSIHPSYGFVCVRPRARPDDTTYTTPLLIPIREQV